jgi:dTDP-4-dehydrorhamnose reductase
MRGKNMKKIGVLGANGMAGHVIFTYFTEKGYDTFGIAKGSTSNSKLTDIDVLDKDKFNNWLDYNNFDVIINCIGLLNQVAENNIDLAIYLNSYLPHYLETKYKNASTKIIHMSTDCVFSGKEGEYTENSFKDGDTFYDRTKALGEIVNDKDEIKYCTKGDNNSAVDPQLVKGESIKGKVVYTIPKIGWPTLFLKGRNDIDKSKVEF